MSDITEGEFEKPRPRVRARSVHELRKVVLARHKVLAASQPRDEAIKLLQETYSADETSCIDFIGWLRQEVPEGRDVLVDMGVIARNAPKGSAMERIHVTSDPKTGDDTYIDTEPGSIPPRPVKPPPKR